MIKTYVKYVSTSIKPASVDCCMRAACLSLSRDLLFLVVVDKVQVWTGCTSEFADDFNLLSLWFFQRLIVCVTGNDTLFYR